MVRQGSRSTLKVTWSKRKQPWQKNLRKIPTNILEQIGNFQLATLRVGCPHKLKLDDIRAGVYAHLDIKLVDESIIFPDKILPLASLGKFSRQNRAIMELIHNDKPKIDKEYSIDSPNYGDWSRGSHQVVWTKQVYERSLLFPKGVSISIEQIGVDVRDQSPIVQFTVDEVLDRTSPSFLDDLFFDLNLLQENIGNHGVIEIGASREQILQTRYVNWEILPPGERDETLVRILSGVRSTNPRIRAQIAERYDFLIALHPVSFIRGTNGFLNYFGAMFADELVVFENMDYGNAVYIMFENWQNLSQHSRVDLLKANHGNDFIRVRHTKNWKERVREEINKWRKAQELG